jgi:hypothetical protein
MPEPTQLRGGLEVDLRQHQHTVMKAFGLAASGNSGSKHCTCRGQVHSETDRSCRPVVDHQLTASQPPLVVNLLKCIRWCLIASAGAFLPYPESRTPCLDYSITAVSQAIPLTSPRLGRRAFLILERRHAARLCSVHAGAVTLGKYSLEPKRETSDSEPRPGTSRGD